jgi:hypothetical protein
MGLKPFVIFVKNGKEHKIIQDGLSWSALFFNVFWLLAKCQWMIFILFCAYYALILFLHKMGVAAHVCVFLYSISIIYLWVYGKKLEMRGLTKRGYRKTRMLMGMSVDDIELYIARAGTGVLYN